MTNLTEFKKPQIIDEDVLQSIEELIAEARAGNVVDIMVVANDTKGKSFVRISDFEDGWRALGALEYAKSSVLKGLGGK